MKDFLPRVQEALAQIKYTLQAVQKGDDTIIRLKNEEDQLLFKLTFDEFKKTIKLFFPVGRYSTGPHPDVFTIYANNMYFYTVMAILSLNDPRIVELKLDQFLLSNFALQLHRGLEKHVE